MILFILFVNTSKEITMFILFSVFLLFFLIGALECIYIFFESIDKNNGYIFDGVDGDSIFSCDVPSIIRQKKTFLRNRRSLGIIFPKAQN